MAWLVFRRVFQEKTGTSIGNAMSNATIIIWASVDCTRQTVALMSGGEITGFWSIFARFAIIAMLFGYGLLVVVLGIKGSTIVRKIGRIKAVTYVFAIFIPVLYNYAALTWSHIIAAVIYFPVFYFALEIIDRITPDPKAIVHDKGMDQLGNDSIGNMGNMGNLDDLTGRYGRTGGFRP
ncbi:MAG: hypothetical protein V1702_00885 [Candidatus Woesearchaeota archaeon]